MAKTQFSFGNGNTDMGKNKTLYSSGIDATANMGGKAADGREVQFKLSKTNFQIGTSVSSSKLTSEAQQQFVSQQTTKENQQMQHEQNRDLKAKLKSTNFSMREQKQGGLVNNYF